MDLIADDAAAGTRVPLKDPQERGFLPRSLPKVVSSLCANLVDESIRPGRVDGTQPSYM